MRSNSIASFDDRISGVNSVDAPSTGLSAPAVATLIAPSCAVTMFSRSKLSAPSASQAM